jgi:hypothetical protein
MGVFPLQLAAYHYWAAGFPPVEAAQWHESWGNVFASATLASWAGAGLALWFLRPKTASALGRPQNNKMQQTSHG